MIFLGGRKALDLLGEGFVRREYFAEFDERTNDSLDGFVQVESLDPVVTYFTEVTAGCAPVRSIVTMYSESPCRFAAGKNEKPVPVS